MPVLGVPTWRRTLLLTCPHLPGSWCRARPASWSRPADRRGASSSSRIARSSTPSSSGAVTPGARRGPGGRRGQRSHRARAGRAAPRSARPAARCRSGTTERRAGGRRPGPGGAGATSAGCAVSGLTSEPSTGAVRRASSTASADRSSAPDGCGAPPRAGRPAQVAGSPSTTWTRAGPTRPAQCARWRPGRWPGAASGVVPRLEIQSRHGRVPAPKDRAVQTWASIRPGRCRGRARPPTGHPAGAGRRSAPRAPGGPARGHRARGSGGGAAGPGGAAPGRPPARRPRPAARCRPAPARRGAVRPGRPGRAEAGRREDADETEVGAAAAGGAGRRAPARPAPADGRPDGVEPAQQLELLGAGQVAAGPLGRRRRRRASRARASYRRRGGGRPSPRRAPHRRREVTARRPCGRGARLPRTVSSGPGRAAASRVIAASASRAARELRLRRGPGRGA